MTSDLQHEFTVEGKLWTLKYRDSDHSYHLREGRDGRWFRVPSASTIAKVSYNDPGGLMGWAVKETQEGRDWRDPQAKEWGTAAHDQLESLALHNKALTLTDQPEHVRGCVQGVASWWLEHRPKFLASEVIVAAPSMRVAGRFDFIAEVGGELVLGDLKTSKPQDWDDWARHKANPAFVQLAGYAAMYAESRWEAPQPTARFVLRVGADGAWDWKRDLYPKFFQPTASDLTKASRTGTDIEPRSNRLTLCHRLDQYPLRLLPRTQTPPTHITTRGFRLGVLNPSQSNRLALPHRKQRWDQ